MKRLTWIIVLCLSGWLSAAESHDAPPGHANEASPHLVLSPDARWAGVMIIVAMGMFLMAAAIGAVVDMNAPDQPPEPADHHDTHGHHAHGSHDAHGH